MLELFAFSSPLCFSVREFHQSAQPIRLDSPGIVEIELDVLVSCWSTTPLWMLPHGFFWKPPTGDRVYLDVSDLSLLVFPACVP